jgi:Ca2+-binding RTX toxin-like protein
MADIKGTADADMLVGTLLQDVIMGGDGNDTIHAADSDDVVYGGAGSDEIFDLYGNDTIYGGSDRDGILDSSGNDAIYGGSGDDVVWAGEGDDAYHGGSGFDTINFTRSLDAVNVDLSKGTSTGSGTDIVQGFEDFIGSRYDDTIKGSKAAETIDGNSGDDVIRGLGGADTLIGGQGADTFHWKWSDVVDTVTGTHLGVDVIKDFEFGDQIDLQPLLDGKSYGNISEVLKLTSVNGGTMIQLENGGAFVDVVFVEGTKPGIIGDGGLLI